MTKFDIPKCLHPAPAQYIDIGWHKFETGTPKDQSYILVRFNNNNIYVEGKYYENLQQVVSLGRNSRYYCLAPSDYWCYLPKEFLEEEEKGELHIWLDYSGCMPKACYSTYTSTKDAIKNKEKYINTTQTKLCVDDLIEQNYRVFVHAGNKKKEITSDFQIDMLIEEWDI